MIQDMIKNIVFIPNRLHAGGNHSPCSLLKETGYVESHDQVNKAKIYEVLIQHPECVSQWLSYSEDQRCTPCWYFRQNENGTYTVGYVSSTRDLKATEETFKKTEYFDITEACAAYIKREIEGIKKICSSDVGVGKSRNGQRKRNIAKF